MKPSIKLTFGGGLYAFVMPEFFDKFPDYKNLSGYLLFTTGQLQDYLHSVEGPAFVGVSIYNAGDPVYAIEGIIMPKEAWEKEILSYKHTNSTERAPKGSDKVLS